MSKYVNVKLPHVENNSTFVIGPETSLENVSSNLATLGTGLGYKALQDLTTGSNNTAIGGSSQADLTEGGHNTSIGAGALLNTQTGNHNTAVGYNSLRSNLGYGNTSGYINTAIGSQSGQNITTGSHNTLLGAFTGQNLTTGSSITCVGYGAQPSSANATHEIILGCGGSTTTKLKVMGMTNGKTTGDTFVYDSVTDSFSVGTIGGTTSIADFDDIIFDSAQNIGIGQDAVDAIQSGGEHNVGIGFRANTSVTTGDDNIAIGRDAGLLTTTATGNVSIGKNTLYNNQGWYNTAIGYLSQGHSNSRSGYNNTALGAQSLYKVTSGTKNVGIGSNAGDSITTGSQNTMIGMTAGDTLESGSNVTCLGYNAEPSSTSVSNEITLGDTNITSLRIPGLSSSASTNDVLTYDGSKIVLATPSAPTMGLNDLTDVFHEGNSLGIGTDALRDEATDGLRNVAIGYRSLINHTTGDDNVALGYDSLLMLDGNNSQNTFVGGMVGQLRTGGSGNSAVGYKSQGGSSATGDNNTSVGSNALYGLQSGHSNVAIGKDAGDSINSGFQNTMIGMDAGETVTNGDNNICIGYNAQASAGTVNNEITLGDTNITSLRIPGLQSGASTNDVLTYDGSKIVLAAAGGGGASAIGDLTDAVYDADYNIGLGNGAIDAITSGGTSNIGIGQDAGTNITTGDNNVALGKEALSSMTTQSSTIGIGYQAGKTNAKSHNVFIGYTAGRDTSTGGDNIVIGSQALRQNTTGQQNVAIGRSTMLNSTSSGNTAIGHNALFTQTAASGNTAIGASAMSNLASSGYNNTAIGGSAGQQLTSGYNNSFVGAGAQPSSASVNNEVTIGNADVDTLRTAGNIMPFTDNAQDLGSASLQWQNIYTGDLHLSNERHKEGNSVDGTTGNWTIQEGAEDLFIINNKNGKKFKFCLKEIQ